jgi:hypothetical protein
MKNAAPRPGHEALAMVIGAVAPYMLARNRSLT